MYKIANCCIFCGQPSLQQPRRTKFNDIITTIFNKICLDLNHKKYNRDDIQWLASLMSVNKAAIQEIPKVLLAVNDRTREQFALQAIQNGYPLVLRALLDAGPRAEGLSPNHSMLSPNHSIWIRHNNHTLITHAVNSGQTNIVRLLLQSKANININDVFIKNPEDLNSCQICFSPFLLSVSKGRIDIAQMLQKAGANIMAKDGKGRNALTIAFEMLYTSRRLREVVGSLLHMGCEINPLEVVESTPLMSAIDFTLQKKLQEEHMKVLRLLIQAGANIQAANNYNHTILMSAVMSGHLDIVKMVIECLKSIRDDSRLASPVDISGSSDEFANPQLMNDILKARDSFSRETALDLAERLAKYRADEEQRIHIYNLLVGVNKRVEAQLKERTAK